MTIAATTTGDPTIVVNISDCSKDEALGSVTSERFFVSSDHQRWRR